MEMSVGMRERLFGDNELAGEVLNRFIDIQRVHKEWPKRGIVEHMQGAICSQTLYFYGLQEVQHSPELEFNNSHRHTRVARAISTLPYDIQEMFMERAVHLKIATRVARAANVMGINLYALMIVIIGCEVSVERALRFIQLMREYAAKGESVEIEPHFQLLFQAYRHFDKTTRGRLI